MTHVTAPAKRNRRPVAPRSLASCASIAVGAALLLGPACALAEVQVQGTPEAARVEVQGDSIDEVLAALNKAFDLRWRTSSPLDKPLTGTYEGSLNRVLTRVLDGYNFVLKASDGRIEITVLGTRGGTAVAGAAAPVSVRPAAPNAAPKSPPPAGPMLAAAASKPVADAPAAPTPTLPAASTIAEAPSADRATVTPPEPTRVISFPVPALVPVPLPTPGQGVSSVPVPIPSAVLPPMPSDAAPPIGEPPAAPKT